MSKCEYFSLWDAESGDLTEWGMKLCDKFETEINDEDRQRKVRLKVEEFPELYERETIDKDALDDEDNERLRKAEATRQSAGLPETCPHQQVEREEYCEFHIGPEKYDEHDDITEESVCESFLQKIRNAEEDDRERLKCFAGSQFKSLSLSYRSITSRSNRPVQLQYADIGELCLNAAVVDELLKLDGSRIGSLSCKNVRFRRQVSFERVTVDCDSILFANSVFEGDISFCDAHMSANEIDFQYCKFQSSSRFGNLDVEFNQGGNEEFINFGYAMFNGEFDCSDSTFFFGDGVDDNAEPYVDFYQCDFSEEVKLKGCDFISGEKKEESKSLFESMKSQEADDGGDDTQWVVLFNESELDKGIDVGDTTIEGDAKFSQVNFGRGEVIFNDVEIRGKSTFDQTLFSGKEADFEGLTVGESLDMSGSVYRVSGGQINFSGLSVEMGANFKQTTLTGNDIDFGESNIFQRSQDDPSDRIAVNFEGTNWEGGNTNFAGTTFGGTTSFDHATFTGGEIDFRRTTVDGNFTFKHAKFHTTKTDFGELTVRNADRLDMSNVDYTSTSAMFDRMEITCDNMVDFRLSVFKCNASFDDTTFRCSDVNFSKISNESGRLDFTDVQTGEDPIDFRDATVNDGEFIIGDYDTVYDFTNATIGDITIRLSESDEAEGKLFEHFVFKNTEFDGFDFSDHQVKEQLKKTQWAIHTSHHGKERDEAQGFLQSQLALLRRYYRLLTVGPDDAVDPNELEVTYMKAKLGADKKGDPDSVSQFFRKELHFRRHGYGYQFWDRSESKPDNDAQTGQESRVRLAWDWFANMTLAATVGYGERPSNVVLTSLVTIFAFTFIYRVISALPPGATWIAYFTYSVQGFIQLVVAVETSGGILVRLFTAIEGFIGAFIIALFVITLTRSINR